jgi:hypothetical protein
LKVGVPTKEVKVITHVSNMFELAII